MIKRRNLLIVNALLLSVLTITCERKVGVHPVPEHLPSEDEIAFRVDFRSIGSSDFPVLVIENPEAKKSFISDTSLDNNFDGLPPTKMDIDPDGNVYMLQVRRGRINVYNVKGELRYSIGKPGRGPGEFQRIYSFDFSDDYTELYVLDFFEVEVFILKNGEYEYNRTYLHNTINLNSICILDDGIFISGFSPVPAGTRNDPENRIYSYPIQKFDLATFEHISSFGFEYRSFIDIPQFNSYMSRNVLACNESTQTVVGQMMDLPYMFGYTPDGEIKWISKFDNFVGTEFTETANPSVTPTNEDYFYKFREFREIHYANYELVQTEYWEPFWYGMALGRGEVPELPPREDPEYTTILVDTETGELFLSGEYGVIGAIRDNRAILLDVERKPFGRDNTVILNEY